MKRMTATKREGRSTVEERVAELKAEGKKDDEIRLVLFEEYPDREVMKSGLLTKGEEPPEEIPESPEERLSFEERLEELEKRGLEKKAVCRTLVLEDYNNRLIVAKFGGLYAKVMREIKAEKGKEEAPLLGAIAGTAKGPGWLDEVKDMIRSQVSRSRELTEVFSDVGLGVLLAGLSKSGVTMEEFQRIALKREGLRDSLIRAGETAFKALEYYQSDLVSKVEAERDFARGEYIRLAADMRKLSEQLDPPFRLERMINNYVLSGGADPTVLMPMIREWLGMERPKIDLEAMR